MSSYVEVWSATGLERVALAGERLTIGRSPRNDIVIADSQTSRLHAVIDLLGVAWCVRDVSSRNGTYVNGSRVSQQTPLSAGDEIRVGRTRIVLRTEAPASHADVEATVAQHRSPRLTHRERDVLLALFLPVFLTDTLTEPATLPEIAKSLWITEAAVRHHLGNLYEKFGIDGSGEQRRTRLANEALRRGAITLAEARAAHEARLGAAGPGELGARVG
jgi:pSer/pThr/pTyr-binding forkhead associated (FHA) protein